jgi:probable rRNA maturation factor
MWKPLGCIVSKAGKSTLIRRIPVSTSSRLFGSKPLPENPPGDIYIEDCQDSLKVDLDLLRKTIDDIRIILGYHSYDVSLILVDDDEMQSTNHESRGMDKPTDILSFPFSEALRPGVLPPPKFDIADYFNLGDMMVDVPYVIRACKDDHDVDSVIGDDDERGVSGAMATVMNPEQRINMLLVHGMLHLVGYDHIHDDDYQLMVSKEEEMLEKLGMVNGRGSH